jgi:uncharacterized membrane protein
MNTLRKISTGFWLLLSKPEYLVVILGLIFGLLILTFTPPFQACDEPQHIFTAYRLSRGGILPDKQNGTCGTDIPKSFEKTYWKLKAKSFIGNVEGKLDTERIWDSFDIKLRAGDTKFEPAYFQYPPLIYLPQAIGMAIGHLFGAPPVLLIYLARLFNLLAVLAVAFFTIRITPVLRWTFFLLFMMPMTLFQISSASADALTIAFSFLAAAYFFHLAFDPAKERIEKRDLYWLLGLALVLSLIKLPYFLLVFGYFLIPARKFGSKKTYFLTFAAMLVEIAVVVVAWHYLAERYTTLVQASFFVPGKHLHWMLDHPVGFARIIYKTLVTRHLFLHEMISGVGWYNVVTPVWLPYAFGISAIAVSLLDKDDIEVRWWQKLSSALIYLVVAFLIMVIIHMSWDKIGDITIFHVNGRYFIPALGFLVLVLYNRKIKYIKGRLFYAAVPALAILFSVTTVTAIIQRFY